MSQRKQIKFDEEDWLNALSVYFGETITQATKTKKRLQGGTVADVFLIQGTAITSSRGEQPYKMVWKHTGKWRRYGDLLSWRREYDWIRMNKAIDFGASLRMPICYYAKINEENNELWIEYVSGVSGNNLTFSMLDELAFQWGEFQGRMTHSIHPMGLENLSDVSFLDHELSKWYHSPYSYDYLCSDQCPIPYEIKEVLRQNNWNDGFSIIYHYIRSEICDLPEHLKQMIMNLDESKNKEFSRLSRLPVVLSHRDLWQENIFYHQEKIYLIDWDCVGWGYLGEDIASLIADDTPTRSLDEMFHRILTSYQRGFSSYADVSILQARDVIIMILIKYGYRLVDQYWFSNSTIEKEDIVTRLNIYYNWLLQSSY